jgi:hypothetical protein
MDERDNYTDGRLDDLATVAQFSYAYQAHLLAGSLEAEGIESYIHGENFVSVYPFMVNDGNGIHVQVRSSQLAQAREIMNRIQSQAIPDTELPKALNVDAKVFHLVHGNCPECNSASIYLQQENAAAVLGVAAIVFALTVPVKVDANYICYNCQHSWKS